MANAEAGRAPLLAPLMRRAAAATARRGLLAPAAEAVVCSFLRATWVLNATNAAFIAARRVFREDSRAAAVARELFVAAVLAKVLLHYFAAPLMLWRLENGSSEAGAREIRAGGERERPVAHRRRPESTGARGSQNGVRRPITALIFFFWAWSQSWVC